MPLTLVHPTPANLQEGEEAVRLSDGSMFAVRIMRKANEEAGIDIIASARAINADGTDELDDAGDPIKDNYSFSSDMQHFDRFGEEATIKEVVGLLLGEEPTVKKVKGVDMKVIGASTEFRNKHNLKKRRAIRKAPKPQLGKALGLR